MNADKLTEAADLIDQVAGLDPAGAVFAARRARANVSRATQSACDLFFAAGSGDLPVAERLAVAYYASSLSRSDSLARHYGAELRRRGVEDRIMDALDSKSLAQLADSRLKALLVFTQALIERPAEGSEAALGALRAAGVATPDIIALAQLVAFLSYQVRLAAGLRAMKLQEQRS